MNSTEIKVSVYTRYSDTKSTKIVSLYKWLFNSKYKDKILEIRNTASSDTRNKLKAQLPCITVSGNFRTREDCGLLKHSGFVCIDLDEKDNRGIDLEETKEELGEAFESLYYAGLSVSGRGLYLIFKIKAPELHRQHYAALTRELKMRGFIADESCRNVSRIRGASWDPNPYFNENATAYEKFRAISKSPRGRPGTAVRETFEEFELNREKVMNLIAQIKQQRIDITEDYKVWISLAYAFISEYGEDGRLFFQQVSRFYPDYCQMECDEVYDRCLKSEPRNTLGTFFYHCKQHGLRYKYPKTDSTTLKK